MAVAIEGFMASGKSTFGRIAAESLGLRFIDLDDEISLRHGTPAEIFSRGGEPLFRKIESEVLKDILENAVGAVIALGGGTVLSRENVSLVRKHASILWLDTSLEVVFSELSNADRPLARSRSGEEIAALYLSRRPVYRLCADKVVIIDSFDYDDAIRRITGAIASMMQK